MPDFLDVLELTDGTPVTFLRESIFPWVRWKYTCLIHYPEADLVHQFDHQGLSRDRETLNLRNAREYKRWDLYTLQNGLVETYYYQFTRPLEAFEYVIERKVDLVNAEVSITLHLP